MCNYLGSCARYVRTTAPRALVCAQRAAVPKAGEGARGIAQRGWPRRQITASTAGQSGAGCEGCRDHRSNPRITALQPVRCHGDSRAPRLRPVRPGPGAVTLAR